MESTPLRLTSHYAVIATRDVAATSAFFVEHFDFQPLFSADWYMHLQARADPHMNLAVLHADHETIPAIARGRTAVGVLLNFEVENVDAVYARMQRAGLPILLPLRDEPFGQRHFITADPNGVLVDIITPIAPSAAFAAQYDAAALPG
ncbi:VOC family protein [Cupriavidus pauculus]|uniref:VOC family protein n=1 Tax=Cupriavidus pauculus TaxID=82633 RepID=UPI00203EAA10|nr:VOC family protein [Cupriavidus pauculus]MCM3606074.1 VOC family protein [Cupriavidus pauculus]